ncbi:MAG: phosphatase PAP2 family protein [Thermoanaerobaculia bacterium]
MARPSPRAWRLAESLFAAAALLSLLFCLLARSQGRLALAIRVDTTLETRVHTWFQAAGIRALEAVSFFGGTLFLTAATLGVAIYLFRLPAPRRLRAFLLAVGGGEIWVQVFKQVFRRARPDLFDPLTRAIGFSFPSGHSTMSAVFYGAIAGLAAASCRSKPCAARALASGLAAIAAIGFSRIALGVHWPTDVLGGWVLGFAWLALVFAVAESGARRGRLSREGGGERSAE